MRAGAGYQGSMLRCINAPNKHFKRGDVYEVAEILEIPMHGMVRKANGRWAKPGEPYFGMDLDEYFEPPPQGIAAISCGYRYQCLEFLGVIIPHSLFPTPLKRRGIELTAKERQVSDAVEEVGMTGLWWRMFTDVLPRICAPETLGQRFLLIGIDYRDAWRLANEKKVREAIRRVMRRLGIHAAAMPKVEDQQLEFWCRSWRGPGGYKWRKPKQWNLGKGM